MKSKQKSIPMRIDQGEKIKVSGMFDEMQFVKWKNVSQNFNFIQANHGKQKKHSLNLSQTYQQKYKIPCYNT